MRQIICPINFNTKAKAKEYFRGINFTLVSVSTVVNFEVWRGMGGGGSILSGYACFEESQSRRVCRMFLTWGGWLDYNDGEI